MRERLKAAVQTPLIVRVVITVGVHQGSALELCFFLQMLYAYDIALLVGVQRQMEKAVQLWQGVLADKDLWLNVKKTKFF